MADDAGDKTEAPTPRRRNEARASGQVARSQELNASVLLLGSLLMLAMFGGGIWRSMLAVMRDAFGQQGAPSVDDALIYGARSMALMGRAMAPMMVLLMVLAIAVLLAQVGWLITWQPLMPNLDKLNPVNGFKRVFSVQALVQLAQNIVKLTLIILVAWLAIRKMLDKIIFAHTLDFAVVFAFGAELLYDLGLKLALILFLLAIVDFFYQRYRHEKQLKMTKQEVKEEMKRMEGDPVIKRRRRQIQFLLARERIGQTVSKADVVVTNPTHYAVAIRYEAETMAAPKVIAKGADYLALRIREFAAAASVPIVEKPELARMLYAEVAVGQEIPEKLYRVVAEVLAYVYEISGRRMGPAPVPVT